MPFVRSSVFALTLAAVAAAAPAFSAPPEGVEPPAAPCWVEVAWDAQASLMRFAAWSARESPVGQFVAWMTDGQGVFSARLDFTPWAEVLAPEAYLELAAAPAYPAP
jgi:hypothetical protein